MDMQLKLRRSKEERMSRGIIQAALDNGKMFSGLDARELSRPEREVSSEQPTLADLVLPGTGHRFSDEFACLLRELSAGESA
jgi:hypothetical protein